EFWESVGICRNFYRLVEFHLPDVRERKIFVRCVNDRDLSLKFFAERHAADLVFAWVHTFSAFANRGFQRRIVHQARNTYHRKSNGHAGLKPHVRYRNERNVMRPSEIKQISSHGYRTKMRAFGMSTPYSI